jgi:hypothetical protein
LGDISQNLTNPNISNEQAGRFIWRWKTINRDRPHVIVLRNYGLGLAWPAERRQFLDYKKRVDKPSEGQDVS